MSTRSRRNFVPLIQEIQKAGWSQQEIARKLRIAQSTVNGACNAPFWEPAWALGQDVLKLHRNVRRRAERVRGAQANNEAEA